MTTEAERLLAETSTASLLDAAYSLTHQMERIIGDRYHEARAKRDLITAEILRRTNP